MINVIIINGINTDVGKTFISCNMIKQKIQNCKKINFLKPVISGFDYNNIEESDTGKALKELNLERNIQNAQKCTKYFFTSPTSPNIAAKIENKIINYNEVLNFCLHKIDKCIQKKEDIIIEMAGGLCTPITNLKTMLDLTQDINKTVKAFNILVTSNYLGSISHTISACKLFDFNQIIMNIQNKTEFDEEIKHTLQNLLKKEIN